MPSLLLASSSRYRRELLQRLRLDFTCATPDVDENPLANEMAEPLVRRLAELKARALADTHTNHLIIGSDQVAALADGRIIGKPHDFERAFAQLRAASGSSVTFHTGLCLFDSRSGEAQVDCIPFTVHFRELGDEEIRRYLLAEQPYDCAGSFKSEGLGVTLFRATEGPDATSLVGLPLIRLCEMLRSKGCRLP